MQQQHQFLLVAVLLWSVLFIAQACEDEVHEQNEPLTRGYCNGASMPTRNKFITHKVNEQSGGCWVGRTFKTRPIPIVGSYSLNIKSPRYPGNYHRNWLVYYNVSCGVGYLMSLKFTDLDLQKAGEINKRKVCKDYVKISAPSIGSDQVFCGEIHKGYPPSIDIPKGEAFITFRSAGGESTAYKGFNIKVHCSKSEESSAMGANCENEEPKQVKHLSSITTRLYQLHHIFGKGAHLLSDAEFGEMLKLGIEAEESCNPMAKAVGTVVLKLFPEEFVKHYKTASKKMEDPDYYDN